MKTTLSTLLITFSTLVSGAAFGHVAPTLVKPTSVFTASASAAAAATAPTLLNVSESVQPGEAVNLQGANLGPAAQVWMQQISAQGQPIASGLRSLTILSGSSNVVQAQAPADLPFGLWQIGLQNAGGPSNVKFINQARGVCYDTTQVAPGGAFRIFGRNMAVCGASSAVLFVTSGGVPLAATVVEADAYHVKALAPAGLVPGTTYQVYISNGMGGSLGFTQMPSPLTARTGGADPFGLGVCWAPDMTFLGNVYNVRTDTRVAVHAAGDGITDDMPALRAAVQAASYSPQGGGVVYLPAGKYLLDNTLGSLSIKNHVVLMGDGMGKTILQYGKNGNAKTWGLDFPNVSLSGLYNLSVQNLTSVAVSSGNLVVYCNGITGRVFLKNVDFDLGYGGQINLSNVDQLLIANSKFTSRNPQHGPFYLKGDTNLSFRSTTVQYLCDRIVLGGVQHGVVEGNTFIRDCTTAGARLGEDGGLEASFSSALVILGNTIKTLGVPDTAHNDGEALLTQNGTTPDFRDAGVLTAADATTLQDTTKDWSQVNTFATRSIVCITGGPALGQWRTITFHDANTLTLDRPWAVTPPAGSPYTITSWATDRLFALGNTFQNNFKGIQIYEGAWDSVIAGNTMTDSDGIALRAEDRTVAPGTLSFGQAGYVTEIRHDPLWNNLVADNTVSNPSRSRLSTVVVSLYQSGGPLHGNGVLNTEVKRNTVTSSQPLPGATCEAGYVKSDGFWSLFWQAPGVPVSFGTPGILGTIYSGDTAAGVSGTGYFFSPGLGQTTVTLPGSVNPVVAN